MLRRVMPKTLAGQLIVMLACVLIVAQAINLTLLVGSQRLQARSIAHQTAIEHAARLIIKLPENLSTDMPLVLRKERGGPQGAFFLSKYNRAENVKHTKNLPRYNARFASLLAAEGITPLRTSVIFLPQGPGLEFKNIERKSGHISGSLEQDDFYHPPRGPRPLGGCRLLIVT